MTIIIYLRKRFLWKYIFLKKVNNIIVHTSCCCSFLYSIEVINLSYALSLVLLMVTRRKPQLQWRRHTNNGINKLNCASTLALKFWYTRRCVSVYLGVVVLRVWYFEHALLQLKNCHHILPEKINPLLHLFAEPHSLYSMSQSTTKIVSFHDNVWKCAHL